MNTLWILFLRVIRNWATRRLHRAAARRLVRAIERHCREAADQHRRMNRRRSVSPHLWN